MGRKQCYVSYWKGRVTYYQKNYWKEGFTSQKLLGGREVKPNPFLLQFVEFCCFTASHFCMASMQNPASTSIFNSSQQGKWDHKCHAQTIMFGGRYTSNWLIMRRQAGCYDNTYHNQPSLICKIQCLLNSVDWYTGHQKLHISRLGLRALLAISCQQRSKEAILHWICWSHKYSLRESL